MFGQIVLNVRLRLIFLWRVIAKNVIVTRAIVLVIFVAFANVGVCGSLINLRMGVYTDRSLRALVMIKTSCRHSDESGAQYEGTRNCKVV
jgi:hypothetical protein